MARYISYKINENEKSWFKLHSSDASKNWWQNVESNLNFITLSEDEFSKCKYSYPFTINDSNQIIFETIPPAPDGVTLYGIPKSEVEKGLKEHIAAMEYHVNNNETPLFTQNDINTLKNIDINNMTWSDTVYPGSWVETAEKNSIVLDHIFEV